MNVPRKAVALCALAAVLLEIAPARGAEERSPREGETPRYESPLVSILLLPVTVLLGIASVFRPDEPPPPRESAEGGKIQR